MNRIECGSNDKEGGNGISEECTDKHTAHCGQRGSAIVQLRKSMVNFYDWVQVNDRAALQLDGSQPHGTTAKQLWMTDHSNVDFIEWQFQWIASHFTVAQRRSLPDWTGRNAHFAFDARPIDWLTHVWQHVWLIASACSTLCFAPYHLHQIKFSARFSHASLERVPRVPHAA